MPHEARAKKNSAAARARRPRARAAQASARTRRRAKIRPRARPRRHAAGAVGTVRAKRPFVRLLEALEAEEIGYVVIGMAAALYETKSPLPTSCGQ